MKRSRGADGGGGGRGGGRGGGSAPPRRSPASVQPSAAVRQLLAGAPRSVDPLPHLAERAPALAKLESLLGQRGASPAALVAAAPAGVAPLPSASGGESLSAPVPRGARRRTTSHARRSMPAALRAASSPSPAADAARPRPHRRKASHRRGVWEAEGRAWIDAHVRAAVGAAATAAGSSDEGGVDTNAAGAPTAASSSSAASDVLPLPPAGTGAAPAVRRLPATHDWHAKRCVMAAPSASSGWHALAAHRSDSGVRAALATAAGGGALAHDASYWLPLLLTSSVDDSGGSGGGSPLVPLLSRVSDPRLWPADVQQPQAADDGADEDDLVGVPPPASGEPAATSAAASASSASAPPVLSRAARARRRRAAARREWIAASPPGTAELAGLLRRLPPESPLAPSHLPATGGGGSEFSFVLHACDAFPGGAVGPVTGVWLGAADASAPPKSPPPLLPRRALLWVHAGTFRETLAALAAAGAAVLPCDDASVGTSGSAVTVAQLGHVLCRFAVAGTGTASVLRRVLTPAAPAAPTRPATSASSAAASLAAWGWAVDPRFTGAMARTAAGSADADAALAAAAEAAVLPEAAAPTAVAHALTSPRLLAALAQQWPTDADVAARRRACAKQAVSVRARVAAASQASVAAAAASDAVADDEETDLEVEDSDDDSDGDGDGAAPPPFVTAAPGGDDGDDGGFIALSATGLEPPQPAVAATAGGGGDGPSRKRVRIAGAAAEGSDEPTASSSAAAPALAKPPAGTVPWPFLLLLPPLPAPQPPAASVAAASPPSALLLPLPPSLDRADVVVPAYAAPAVWRALTAAPGGRSAGGGTSAPGVAVGVGRDEWAALATVAGQPVFPRDFPDTAAGAAADAEGAEALFACFVARPRAHRPNYAALRSPAPFGPRWELLWQPSPQPPPPSSVDRPLVSVVRGRPYVAGFLVPRPTGPDDAGDDDRGAPSSAAASGGATTLQLPSLTAAATLLRVRLCLWDSGPTPEPGATLCVPTAADLRAWLAAAARRGNLGTGGGCSGGSSTTQLPSRHKPSTAGAPSPSVLEFPGAGGRELPVEPPGAGHAWPAKTASAVKEAAASAPAAGDYSHPLPLGRSQEDGLMTMRAYLHSVLDPGLNTDKPTRQVVGFVTAGVYDSSRKGMQEQLSTHAAIGVGFLRCEAFSALAAHVAESLATEDGGTTAQCIAQARADAVFRASTPSGCVANYGGAIDTHRQGPTLLLLLRNPGTAQHRFALAEAMA